jgi:DNA-binding CsgD family transcriptional regulator
VGRSQRLHLSDVRRVFRLLGEVRELGAEPLAWRHHILQSLGRIINVAVAISGELQYEKDIPRLVPESFGEVRIPRGGEGNVLLPFLTSEASAQCPVFRALARWETGCRTRAYSAKHIERTFGLRAWSSSALIQQHCAAGLEACIYSQHSIPLGRACHAIVLYRQRREPAFTSGQTRLIHVFHEELGRLWHLQVRADSLDLRPRLRQTLDGLCSGLSEKQIAKLLGLSQHTVHNYVKELHRHFGVSSRGELLARWTALLRPHFVPRLTSQPPLGSP